MYGVLVAVDQSIVVSVVVVMTVVTVLKPDDGVKEIMVAVELEFVIGLPSVLLVDGNAVGAVLSGGLGVKGG